MMPSLLLIFATRYDDVTRRTFGIAQRLRERAEHSGIATLALFEAAATGTRLLDETANRPTVIAIYSHGDVNGEILAQDQQPCWTNQTVPDLSGITLFAHACRGIRWLTDQVEHHKARLLVGYAGDLISPVNGSAQFWEIYQEVHSFVPQHLAARADDAWVRTEFYELCTRHFHKLNLDQAPLIELVAVQQSRDELVFV
jgi:hypothetical protein